MRLVSYDQQTVNSPNPLARFSHRRRVAKSVKLAAQHLPANGAIVDFGAGTGLFLSSLGQERPDATLFAIEPFMAAASDARIRYISGLNDLTVKPNLITAYEVCEHLTDGETQEFLAGVSNALQPNGKLIVSVPIMIGAALIMKELNRVMLFRRAPEYSLSELLAGTIARPVERPADRRPTHKGFDFRLLRKKLSETFIVENEILSPLPAPWWTNSQIFFICRQA